MAALEGGGQQTWPPSSSKLYGVRVRSSNLGRKSLPRSWPPPPGAVAQSACVSSCRVPAGSGGPRTPRPSSKAASFSWTPCCTGQASAAGVRACSERDGAATLPSAPLQCLCLWANGQATSAFPRVNIPSSTALPVKEEPSFYSYERSRLTIMNSPQSPTAKVIIKSIKNLNKILLNMQHGP